MAFNFNGNTPKKILYNGLNVAKLVYNNVVVWMSKVLATIVGILPLNLTDCTGDDLVDYKIYGNTEEAGSLNPLLPDGYTQVEYIQGTGTQWIDTGRKMYNNSEIEFCFSFDVIQQNCSIFGSRVTGSNNNFEIASATPEFPIYLDYGNYATSRAIYNDAVINTKYICTISKSLRAVYDENRTLLTRNTNLISADNVTPSNARIFDTAGGYSVNKLKGKVYYCKIWENGVLIRDMIPCKNPSNVAGLYDTVNDVFYTNAGTGTFNTGSSVVSKKSVGDLVTDTSDTNYGKYKIPVLTNSHTTNIYLNKPLRKTSKLPTGYTQVEYLESTGTQYIDTDYNYSVNTKIKGRFEATTTVSGGATLFGTYGAGSSRAQVLLRSGNIKGLQLWSGITNANTESSSLYEINVPFNIETEWTNTTATLKFNDNAVLSVSNQFRGTPTFKIFSANGTSQFFTGRIYYLEIYNNGILVRNMIPCINNQNVIGMYDLVSDTFFTNAGTGSFVAGAEVETVYYTDYLDYENQKVVRNVDDNYKGIDTPVEESVVLPAVPTDEGTTVFDVDTDVTPSYAEVKYYTQPIENKTLKTSDNLVFVTSDNKIFKLKEEE